METTDRTALYLFTLLSLLHIRFFITTLSPVAAFGIFRLRKCKVVLVQKTFRNAGIFLICIYSLENARYVNLFQYGFFLLTGELRQHFAQFGHIKKCTVPFDRETGFHKGIGWVQFSSQEELQNALQQESHIIDGVKIYVQAQKPKGLQGAQTSDEEKDF
ncbi:SRA stem-loop-interacting RNA-binding protein, mitochondrial [Acomys russatus]|uniref:SRA stem-loop-interacting RNA-binding protein, mitochondrial n=1 Tax=Acomys russatus TaxID=60746 RepID=UPI0021E1F89A|nr:SRA stem-loop-interacting RNA-binding protein, mitochondrial [Acomys russatus]